MLGRLHGWGVYLVEVPVCAYVTEIPLQGFLCLEGQHAGCEGVREESLCEHVCACVCWEVWSGC